MFLLSLSEETSQSAIREQCIGCIQIPAQLTDRNDFVSWAMDAVDKAAEAAKHGRSRQCIRDIQVARMLINQAITYDEIMPEIV